MGKKYYIVTEEWNYPTESGRNVCEDWDTLDEALKQAKELAEAEEQNNFFNATKCDPLPAIQCVNKDDCRIIDGYIVTPKNCLDQWYYFTRIIPVEML